MVNFYLIARRPNPKFPTFHSTMESAWVDYAGKFVDATTTQMISNTNAYATLVGRRAASEGSAGRAGRHLIEMARSEFWTFFFDPMSANSRCPPSHAAHRTSLGLKSGIHWA